MSHLSSVEPEWLKFFSNLEISKIKWVPTIDRLYAISPNSSFEINSIEELNRLPVNNIKMLILFSKTKGNHVGNFTMPLTQSQVGKAISLKFQPIFHLELNSVNTIVSLFEKYGEKIGWSFSQLSKFLIAKTFQENLISKKNLGTNIFDSLFDMIPQIKGEIEYDLGKQYNLKYELFIEIEGSEKLADLKIQDEAITLDFPSEGFSLELKLTCIAIVVESQKYNAIKSSSSVSEVKSIIFDKVTELLARKEVMINFLQGDNSNYNLLIQEIDRALYPYSRRLLDLDLDWSEELEKFNNTLSFTKVISTQIRSETIETKFLLELKPNDLIPYFRSKKLSIEEEIREHLNKICDSKWKEKDLDDLLRWKEKDIEFIKDNLIQETIKFGYDLVQFDYEFMLNIPRVNEILSFELEEPFPTLGNVVTILLEARFELLFKDYSSWKGKISKEFDPKEFIDKRIRKIIGNELRKLDPTQLTNDESITLELVNRRLKEEFSSLGLEILDTSVYIKNNPIIEKLGALKSGVYGLTFSAANSRHEYLFHLDYEISGISIDHKDSFIRIYNLKDLNSRIEEKFIDLLQFPLNLMVNDLQEKEIAKEILLQFQKENFESVIKMVERAFGLKLNIIAYYQQESHNDRLFREYISRLKNKQIDQHKKMVSEYEDSIQTYFKKLQREYKNIIDNLMEFNGDQANIVHAKIQNLLLNHKSIISPEDWEILSNMLETTKKNSTE